MFHIFWMVFSVVLGLSLASFLLSLFPVTGWVAAITFAICAVPGGFLSWYLYWGGRWVATPIANWLFKNPVAPKKRLIDGMTLRAVFVLALVPFVFLIFGKDPDTVVRQATYNNIKNNFGTIVVGLSIVCFWLSWMLKSHPGLFIWVGKLTWSLREDDRRSRRGDGGDAQFAGFWKETDYPWIPGCILLGESLYRKFWVGFKQFGKNESDDRHIITMAGSRAGKGVSRIIPNLLLWQENVICIDPKGENAHVTARQYIRAQAYVIDPYGLVKNVHPKGEDPNWSMVAPHRLKYCVPPIRAKYNPLQDIDPFSLTAQEEITVLVDAMVLAQSEANQAWETTPKEIIGGVIGHVLTTPEYKKDRSLVMVYRLLNGSIEEMKTLIIQMRKNDAMGDFIPAGANTLETAVLESKQSFIQATRTSLKWLSFPEVQKVVGGESDFSIYDIADRPMSIYLCFDIEALQNLNRFVRIFFLMAFHAMTHPRPGRPKTKKVLFLMDEFFVLGYLPILKKSAQYIAGEGVKLWPIIQNITMIEELYGKAWTNFTEAAGAIEAFGLSAGDKDGTAAWVENKLGKSRSANLKLGDAARSNEIQPLMTQSEIEQEFKREDDRSIMFIKGEDPLVLRRKPYWELFHRLMYSDPPQGTPLSVFGEFRTEETGWTHHVYFGSDSMTLRTMGTPFKEEQRLDELANNRTEVENTQRQQFAEQARSQSSDTNSYNPHPKEPAMNANVFVSLYNGQEPPQQPFEKSGWFSSKPSWDKIIEFQKEMHEAITMKDARRVYGLGPDEEIDCEEVQVRRRDMIKKCQKRAVCAVLLEVALFKLVIQDVEPLTEEERQDERLLNAWEKFCAARTIYLADLQHGEIEKENYTMLTNTHALHFNRLRREVRLITAHKKAQAAAAHVAEHPQETVVEAPAPPVKEYVLKPVEQPVAPPVAPDLIVDEAISVFVFENKEALELGELTRQYKKFAIREGLSPEMLEEIDTAYQVLRAHLEKKVAHQAERTLFGFGPTDIITREDLRDRYELASEKTDSKAEQKALDEAYQVLLKIAV